MAAFCFVLFDPALVSRTASYGNIATVEKRSAIVPVTAPVVAFSSGLEREEDFDAGWLGLNLVISFSNLDATREEDFDSGWEGMAAAMQFTAPSVQREEQFDISWSGLVREIDFTASTVQREESFDDWN